MNIPIGKIGQIINSDTEEQYIKVEDDLKNTGGYLIWRSANLDFVQAYDGWTPKADLQAYFEESRWQIKWLDIASDPVEALDTNI